jgi:transposase
MSNGKYLGGHTVMRDPAWPGKLASRMRKTAKANAAKAEAAAKFREEMESFEQRERFTLIKARPH